MEPLTIGHHLVSLLRQVVVAGHDRNTFDKDFSIFCDLDEVSWKRQAHGTNGVLSNMLNSDRPGCLGETVALEKCDTHTRVELGKVGS